MDLNKLSRIMQRFRLALLPCDPTIEMPKLVLLGNSVNRLTGGGAWTDVLKGLAAKAQLTALSLRGKPLPIVYEYVVSRSERSEQALKEGLATSMGSLRPNPAHRRALAVAGQQLLTTNYDYCFEFANGGHFERANLKSESTYSAFRRVNLGNRFIWHIHGELNGPRTIMLGLHQYAGYLQKLRNYLTSSRKQSPFLKGSLDFEQSGEPFSWVDLFLRDDVHIGGLTMDYVEIHLWWLIAFKLRVRKRMPCGATYFYHFKTARDGEGVASRLGMLKDIDVTVQEIPVDNGDWKGAHARMFDKIEVAKP